jgi:CDP-glucose 4,6-dehydratase
LEGLGVDPEFWRGRRVLLTGHTGFKGSWLALWLESLGSEVVGLSNGVPTTPSLFELARVGEGVRSIEGDIRDPQTVERALADSDAEIVIHMAAQSLVRRSFEQPVETYATNVMGTVHVLDAARRSDRVRVVVNVTTDKCYENREWVWGYREHEPMGGYDPYSNSKACAELVTAAFRSSYAEGEGGPAIASARAGNVIGGGDWAEDRLVPDLMRAAVEGRSALVRNPDAIRPWQHVLNPLSGYLMLAQALWDSPEHAEAWNFGPEDADARTVRWMIDRLSETWREPIAWRQEDGETPHEAQSLKLDSSKARARLGWSPTWGLQDALTSIAVWYKAQQSGADPRRQTLDQIAAFQAGERPLAAGNE